MYTKERSNIERETWSSSVEHLLGAMAVEWHVLAAFEYSLSGVFSGLARLTFRLTHR